MGWSSAAFSAAAASARTRPRSALPSGCTCWTIGSPAVRAPRNKMAVVPVRPARRSARELPKNMPRRAEARAPASSGTSREARSASTGIPRSKVAAPAGPAQASAAMAAGANASQLHCVTANRSRDVTARSCRLRRPSSIARRMPRSRPVRRTRMVTAPSNMRVPARMKSPSVYGLECAALG